ncbi:heterokaryon incompatibility protein-domain-containing protein [Xylaria longipes]|nr:heterokaryon incompatibility protein-domain-containing protein [Xylaria longipes]
MRLIETRSSSYTIKEFVGAIPRYAILSHTWGEDEVTLQDMQSSIEGAKKKRGFSKIEGCCGLARGQGIYYAWIDTCCIDKTNGAELSEAINSMFSWYKNAEVCYAYLSDVFPDDVPITPATLSSSIIGQERFDDTSRFFRSRWFSRCWTLQELLAPELVEFYTKDWQRFGTRNSLENYISQVTGIRPEILSEGFSPRSPEYSVAERMSWAAKRTTTRIEDCAYSLLGIFNVNMPLIYGEGPKAFHRLQVEIIRWQEDYTILAWGNEGLSNTIPHDTQCEALSSSPSAFKQDYSSLHATFQWNSESIVASPNGDEEMIPPMSMTSRGLSLSVRLIYRSFGGRTFCLAILGYGPSGRMVGIPLQQVTRGRVFARLCVEGDYGGFIYVDGTDAIRNFPYTSIYIRTSDNELPLPRDLGGLFLRVRTTNMDSCIAWMEPIPVVDNKPFKGITARTNKNRVILTGKESIFARTKTTPAEFLLRTYHGIKFILPCMNTQGTIFGVILQPYGSHVVLYLASNSPGVVDTSPSSIDRFWRAVEEMQEIENSWTYGVGKYRSEQLGLTVRYIPDSDAPQLRCGTWGSDVTISSVPLERLLS